MHDNSPQVLGSEVALPSDQALSGVSHQTGCSVGEQLVSHWLGGDGVEHL